MTSESGVGHLYHDAHLQDASVILDAKEHLRMREINAREERNLEQLERIYERGKQISERRFGREFCEVEQQLRQLYIRTPHLQNTVPQLKSRDGDLSPYPAYQRTNSELAYRLLNNVRVRNGGQQQNTTGTDDSFYSRCVNNGRINGLHQQNNGLVRRAEHIARVLQKLQKRSIHRYQKCAQRRIEDILEPDSLDALEKAAVVLRDRDEDSVFGTISNMTMSSRAMRLFGDSTRTSPADSRRSDTSLHVPSPFGTSTMTGEGDLKMDIFLPSASSYREKLKRHLLSRPKVRQESLPHLDKADMVRIVVDSNSTPANHDDDSIHLSPTGSYSPDSFPVWTELAVTPNIWRQVPTHIPSRRKKKRDTSAVVTLTGRYRMSRMT